MNTLKEKILKLYPGCKFKLGETEEETTIYINLGKLLSVDFGVHPGGVFLKMIARVDDAEIDLLNHLSLSPTSSGVGLNRNKLLNNIKNAFDFYISSHPTTAQLSVEEKDFADYCDKLIDVVRTNYKKQYNLYFGEPTKDDESVEYWMESPTEKIIEVEITKEDYDEIPF